MSSGGPSVAGASSSSSLTDIEHIHHDMALPAAADVSIVSIQDKKEQALQQVLKSDLMAKLNKEVKSLDEDSWMFDGPRSCIHLISGPGGLRHRCIDVSAPVNDLALRK